MKFLVLLLFLSNFSWAGETEVQALYRVYEDGDTTITSPSIDVKTTLYEDQLKLGAGYAADAVTSASSDIRTFGSKDANGEVVAIEEKRNEFSGNAEWSTKSGAFGLGYIQSKENDYDSKIVAISASREFFQKNTVLSLSFLRGNDLITSSADPLFSQPMEHQTYSLSVTQILDKISLIQIIADFRIENGFLASPYRRARVLDGTSLTSVPENHPGTRNRNAFAVRYNRYLADWKLSTSSVFRYYKDSWGVGSITLEERLSRPILAQLDATINLRYYNQSKADFYQDTYTSSELTGFFTGNNTLGTLSSIMIGFRPTYKINDQFSVFAKVELYKLNYKDHTDLGNAADSTDDKALEISSTNIGIGLTAKY